MSDKSASVRTVSKKALNFLASKSSEQGNKTTINNETSSIKNNKTTSQPELTKTFQRPLKSPDYARFSRSIGIGDDPSSSSKKVTAELVEDAAIKVTVDDPKKMGTMVDKTLNFRIKGVSILFDPPEFEVRRYWQDFVWFERALILQFAYLLVPMIMKKNRSFNFNDDRDAFKRCLEMQRWLHRIASHPALVSSELLQAFLTKEYEEFKLYKKEIDEKTSLLAQSGNEEISKPHKGTMKNKPTVQIQSTEETILGDTTEQRIARTRIELEEVARAIIAIQNSSMAALVKGNAYSMEAGTLADAFSLFLPEFDSNDVIKSFAKSQQTDATQLLKMFNSDRYETYEITKSWQNIIYSTKELLIRYDQAKERAEYWRSSSENKVPVKIKGASVLDSKKVAQIAMDTKEIFSRHTSNILRELDRFEEYKRRERLHWAGYYARLRIQSYRESINSWKNFIDMLDDYAEEERRKRKEAHLLKNLEKTSPFRISLKEIMEKQKNSHPDLKIPFILKILTDSLIQNDGLYSLGIFRKSMQNSILQQTKLELEKENYNVSLDDATLCSCLIKSWIRDIKEPLIPAKYYNECINQAKGSGEQLKKILDKFPEENVAVLHYLIILCREIAAHEDENKMGYSNLAIVMSPGICRCPDMENILANTRKETDFICSLIKKLEIEGSVTPAPFEEADKADSSEDPSKNSSEESFLSPREKDRTSPTIPQWNAGARERKAGESFFVKNRQDDGKFQIGSRPTMAQSGNNRRKAEFKDYLETIEPEPDDIDEVNSSEMLTTELTYEDELPPHEEYQDDYPLSFDEEIIQEDPHSMLENHYAEVSMLQVMALADFFPENDNEAPLLEGHIYNVHCIDATGDWYQIDGPEPGSMGWVPKGWCAPLDFDIIDNAM